MRATGTSSGSQVPALATQASSRPSASTAPRDERVGRRLVAQVGLQRDAADLCGERLGRLGARVVVDADARALGRQRTRRRRADAARRAGDQDRAAFESELHGRELSRTMRT